MDQQIMLLLGVRFRCTDMIGELKTNHGMDLVDPKREAQQVER
ncbi:chorismate mutase, partial [Achromobacter sp. KAs 3-5]